MALPIEGYSIVVKKERIYPLLENHSIAPPNSTALEDDDLWRCSFMAKADADDFIRKLGELELNIDQGPDSDAISVNEFDQSIDPYCEWFLLGKWEKAVIGWKEGSNPKTVVAHDGWDPKVGSGLSFHNPSSMENLQFLRLDGNVEVFLNKDTGKEVYIGRTSTPVNSMFQTASEVIAANFVTAGEPSLTGEAAKDVAEAVDMLAKVIDKEPNWWNALWFYGKGFLALGNHEKAYKALRRAFDLEHSIEYIPRELAAVCLELQQYDEAVSVSEKAAALSPDKADVLGNLSLAYLMAGKIDAAKTTVLAALKIDASDKINNYLQQIILEVVDGSREQPLTLADLSKPIKAKKKPFWKIW